MKIYAKIKYQDSAVVGGFRPVGAGWVSEVDRVQAVDGGAESGWSMEPVCTLCRTKPQLLYGWVRPWCSPYIQKRPRMLSCQVLLKSADYNFLSHDSYANCAQPIRAKFEIFTKDDRKYCGILNETDLKMVQQRIIASGNLTVDEINTFFKK